MLKVLRLAINNRRNFSLFQLNKLFKQAASQQILVHNHNSNSISSESGDLVNNLKMSTAETNGSTSSPQTSRTQNLDGMVKFLELLGKLKVSYRDAVLWNISVFSFSFNL